MNHTAARLKTRHDVRLAQERQRLADYGGAVLSDRELLALLIGCSAPRHDAHTLVERLLIRFGSIAAIAKAHPVDLTQITGIGPATATRLAAAFTLAHRTVPPQPPTQITTPADVAKATRPLLHGHPRERLVVLVCNRANRILGHEILSDGSADQTLLPIRETIAAVLRRDGQAFALAHNHPSGDPTPSHHDIHSTALIKRAANTTGLRLLTHLVVTDNTWRTVPINT